MSSSEAKSEKATQRKLNKQRAKGQVSKAPNLSLYFGQFLAFLTLMGISGFALSIFHIGLDRAFDVMLLPVEQVFVDAFADTLKSFALVAGPVFGCVLTSAIITKLIYQKGFVFSVDPLIPKLEKISPTKGFKRMFGKRGWVELSVSLVRLAIWGGAFWTLFYTFYYRLLGSVICGWTCLVDVSLNALVLLIFVICVLFIVFAVLEGLIQNFLFAGDQKMTKSEVKQERKDQMGSKEVRSKRKQFAQELQESAGSVGVDNATFAIYYGDMVVAIRYHPEDEPIPKLSAKAKEPHKANQMRKRIWENGCRETEDEVFVTEMIKKMPGDVVPENLYPLLVELIKRMFAPG